MTDGASFSLIFSDTKLEISGSELFVSQQIDGLREQIVNALQRSKGDVAVEHSTSKSPAAVVGGLEAGSNVDGKSGPANPYPYVLDVMNEKVKITKAMKGATTAEKAVKLALVYLWGKEKLLGQSGAETKEIRELCEEHACLDPSNFASHLSSRKEYLLIDGIKGSNVKQRKLTYPGRAKAEEYLKEMNEV